MAFSLRKMLSNMNYFKKPGESYSQEIQDHLSSPNEQYVQSKDSDNIDFDPLEPVSTSNNCATSLKLPESLKNFAAKKDSLSDTDTLAINIDSSKKEKRKSKKLKLDISKCNQSLSDDNASVNNVENTPKHVLLDNRNTDLFNFKGIDLNSSFDIFDAMSDESSICEEEEMDIESLSDRSDSDISLRSDDKEIKMCRKVDSVIENLESQLVPSATPESFGDVEVDRNEEERIALLLNYHMRLEKLDCFLKKLLTEFKFHIEVSKVFHCRSVMTTLPGTDLSNIPKKLGEVTYIDNVKRGISPTGSWNIILEKEDNETKSKISNQLISMKDCIDDFIRTYLKNEPNKVTKCKKFSQRKSITFDLYKGKRQKRLRCSNKKKQKHFDFPDLRDVMINLFNPDTDNLDHSLNATNLSDLDEAGDLKCECRCRLHRSPSTQTDSGVTTKNDRSMSSQSITSSLGNFSLDSSTLTAYSESLDLIVSYNSFQDTSLYSTLLQKAAIERITFYVQVHSIQLKCEPTDQEFESKNAITFSCPACKTVESEENGLLKHILSQSHCEKIHFLYKTAYIKKCVAAGKEIMPSTVLNPMKMYRDDNKIVCFGDAMYACSLCFENLIVGESVLMSHCSDPSHVERREMLNDILE